jgi:hypothetical protein
MGDAFFLWCIAGTLTAWVGGADVPKWFKVLVGASRGVMIFAFLLSARSLLSAFGG